MRQIGWILIAALVLVMPLSVANAQQPGAEIAVSCDRADADVVREFNRIGTEVYQGALALFATEASEDFTGDVGAVFAVSSRLQTELLGERFEDLINTCTEARDAVRALGTVVTLAYNQTLNPYLAPGGLLSTLPALPDTASVLTVGQGVGVRSGFWDVYFNQPTGSGDRTTYVNGIDVPLAQAIAAAQNTLDIAAFEFNNAVLTEAVIDAHERGVTVRVVTDDEHGVEDEESILDFEDAGIPIVDDDRSALMHNKFMIIDDAVVWTGSWNYTVNGTYRNDNNALVMRSLGAVAAYQAEFNEMFERGEFGPRSEVGATSFIEDETPVRVLFAAEDEVVEAINGEIAAAQDSVRFMAFSFTQDDIGAAMRAAADRGVEVSGVFELRGSETRFSEMPAMFCAGLDVRQDGSRYVLHHKVIIVDDATVLTGSFNFSANATESNDENLVILRDETLASLFLAEY